MEKRKEEKQIVKSTSPHTIVSNNNTDSACIKDKGDSLPIGRLLSIEIIRIRAMADIKRGDKYSPNVIAFLIDNCIKKIPFTTEDLIHAEMHYLQQNVKGWINTKPKIESRRYWKNIHVLENMGILKVERKRKYADIYTVS
jgi:hypothetical protein